VSKKRKKEKSLRASQYIKIKGEQSISNGKDCHERGYI
jgi:hypothetical protein